MKCNRFYTLFKIFHELKDKRTTKRTNSHNSSKRKRNETTNQPSNKRMRKINEESNIHHIHPILLDLSFEGDKNEGIDNDNDTDIEMSTNENQKNEEYAVVVTTPQKKRNKFEWIVDSEWDNLESALEILDERGFVHYDSSDLKCGQKFYFRCKSIPKERKTWCAKRFTIFLPSDNLKVLILHNQLEHDHDKLLEGAKKPLSDEMVEYITDIFKCGTTKVPEVIKHINIMKEKRGLFVDEATPEKRQIEYLLRKFRNTDAPTIIKLGDLSKWCNENESLPDDINEAFIIGQETSGPEERLWFRFVLTTRQLLEKLSNAKTICIDATYKLNWQGFPLMVLGTVDRSKRFHPFVYACCTNERTTDYAFIFESVKCAIKKHFNKEFEPEVMIADGAESIRNAYYLVFTKALLDVMCFAHVLRNCLKRPFSAKKNKQLVIDDIKKIQLSPNRMTFEMMCKLFCEKWNCVEPDFVAYFKKEWLGVHCNWFEGAADYTPSTNNGQESHNAVIKRKITLRRRLPLNQFLVCMKDMATDISRQFANGKRAIATEPNVKDEILDRAALMVQNNFKAFKAKGPADSTVIIYSVPSSQCENASESYYKTLVRTEWKTFDEFVVHGYQKFYIVKLSTVQWKTESSCTCTYFFKNHMCKHIIALAIRSNIVEMPQESNPVLVVATRRKNGRPKRTASALNVQN